MTDNTVRTAVVTGAGSGLGRAIALQLAAEGRNIACVDLDGQAARDTATRVRERGRRRLMATRLLALIPPLRPLAGASS